MVNHLISLELQGYKTFANKTDFHFPAQLTAIVGPNGSGKSNIADAVRWVLGEQAYSLLRGKKTIDMIFTGSEQRPRASMASVSITLDNSSGWLPIDFNEVNITRRAYRSGENEYLINNQRVRLREINELLANSGLAERNYTIIGQGLVDSALSIKPEDRRRFFEEAAGIGLYRSRRAEANQKLDKTYRNVERVTDIINELQPRIRTLEKQQEKSKTYLQIDADLKLLLKDWYGYYWHSTQKNLGAAVAFNAQQQNKLDKSRVVRQDEEEKLKNSKNNLQTKREKLSHLHHDLSDLHTSKEDNMRKLAVLEERQKSMKSRIIEFEGLVASSLDNKDGLEEDVNEIKEQEKRNIKEFSSIDHLLSEAKESLENRLNQRSEINSLIYSNEKEINSINQETLRLSTLIGGMDRQINIQTSDKEEIRVINIETKTVFSRSADELVKSRQIIGEKKKVISTLKENLLSLESKLGDKRKDLQNFEQIKQKNDRNISRLQSDHGLLEEAESAMVGFSSGAKNILEAAKNGKLTGNYSILMEYLAIPEEFEIALASALGSLAEGIILDSDQDTKVVLNYIKNEKMPRTTLIRNISGMRVAGRSLSLEGDHITALDLLPKEKRKEPFLNYLLSRILIVEDQSHAEKIVGELPEGYRVVTRDGVVFSTEFTITAGKESRVRSFSRKREKTEIKGQLINEEKANKEIIYSLEATIREINELQAQLDKDKALSHDSEIEVNRLVLDLHKKEIEQEQRGRQLDSAQSRLDSLLLEIEKEKLNIVELKHQETILEEKSTKLISETEKLYVDLKELPVEELRLSVSDLSSKFAVAEQISANIGNRIAEKENLLEALEDSIKRDSTQKLESTDHLSAILEDIESIRNHSKKINSNISELSDEVNPLEKVVEDEITNQSLFLEKVDQSRRHFSIAERQKMQAQMKVEKLRDRLDGYQKKIGEDFGILLKEDEGMIYGPKPLPIEGVVASLPRLDILPEGLSDQIAQKKSLLRRIGPVNPNAQQEYKEVFERSQFLKEQLQDLDNAEKDLRKIVGELDGLMIKEFMKTFKKVEVEFENIFSRLFNGGKAKLIIEDEENLLDSGIDIEATLPGRRKQELALLSGGERSLTAVALIFALLKISPTPFCVLDEIDAMLDESNVMRVGLLLKELSETTQFIIITHNRNTVQLADIIYGVTMGKDSVSQVISLKLEELTEEMIH